MAFASFFHEIVSKIPRSATSHKLSFRRPSRIKYLRTVRLYIQDAFFARLHPLPHLFLAHFATGVLSNSRHYTLNSTDYEVCAELPSGWGSAVYAEPANHADSRAQLERANRRLRAQRDGSNEGVLNISHHSRVVRRQVGLTKDGEQYCWLPSAAHHAMTGDMERNPERETSTPEAVNRAAVPFWYSQPLLLLGGTTNEFAKCCYWLVVISQRADSNITGDLLEELGPQLPLLFHQQWRQRVRF